MRRSDMIKSMMTVFNASSNTGKSIEEAMHDILIRMEVSGIQPPKTMVRKKVQIRHEYGIVDNDYSYPDRIWDEDAK